MKVVFYSPQAANIHERLEDISRDLHDCGVIILNGTHGNYTELRVTALPNHHAIRIGAAKGDL